MLSAVILVAHLMLGCCAHHAHGCEDSDHSPIHQEHAAPHNTCPDGCDGQADHSHHGPLDCKGGSCSVVLANRTTGQEAGQGAKALVTPLLDDLFSASQVFLVRWCDLSGGALPPVRLHLVHQVLLI
jgi:hypothetical protein